MNEKSIFLTRCLLSASIGDSLYLLGVWFLGSVTVTQSVLLGSLTFTVSLPLTFALDRRTQSLVVRLHGRVEKASRGINRMLARPGPPPTAKDVTDLQSSRPEPSRTVLASELENGLAPSSSGNPPHCVAEPVLGHLFRDRLDRLALETA